MFKFTVLMNLPDENGETTRVDENMLFFHVLVLRSADQSNAHLRFVCNHCSKTAFWLISSPYSEDGHIASCINVKPYNCINVLTIKYYL